MASLSEIAARRDRAESAVDGVVVKASGLANPGVVGEMLRETGLDERFTLEGDVREDLLRAAACQR